MKKLLISTAILALSACSCDNKPMTIDNATWPKETPSVCCTKDGQQKAAVKQSSAAPAQKQTAAQSKQAVGHKGQWRSQFTSDVKDREPIDKLSVVEQKENGRLVFFSEIVDQKDKTIYHVWKRNGEEFYRIDFKPTSNKWRANSNVNHEHFQPGDVIVVETVDSKGNVFDTYGIKIK